MLSLVVLKDGQSFILIKNVRNFTKPIDGTILILISS